MAEEKSKKSNTVEQVKPEDKGKALAAALAQIEKQFGKGSIMKMDGSHKDETLEVISTGSLGLDLALGVGGLPRGRIVEIFGPESSGKPPSASKPSPNARKTAAPAPLSTPKTPSTPSTPAPSASKSKN